MIEEVNSLWQERFRPTTTKKIFLPSKVRRLINKIISAKTLPNLIIYHSRPGTGKTSLAKSLCNDLGYEYLYINGSLSANIDLLRTDIKQYCESWSIDNEMKVVIIDDIGSNSFAFQSALKVFVEQYSKVCRFIITTNSLNYIIQPLRESRFEVIEFNYEDQKVKDEMVPQIKKAFGGLLKNLNIKYSEIGLNQLIENSFPDIRWCLRSLQVEFLENGEITENITKMIDIDKDLYQMILDRKLTEVRKYLIEKNINYQEMYSKLFREFIPLIEKKSTQAQAIIEIEKYMDNSTRSIDQEITFTALLLQIISIL